MSRPSTISGMLRFLLVSLPLSLVGVAGYMFYQHVTEKERVIAEQRRIISELAQKLDRAWASELVADVRVDRLVNDPVAGRQLDLTFVQYQPGTEVPALRRAFTLSGEELYIDALIVQFERSFVEEGDALRGKSLLLFRRAFGDQQKPADGVPLFRGDGESLIPELAQVDATPSEFEQQLWGRFWTYANDPATAAADGIRVAQGEAPHVKAVAGQVYKLTLRASGGLEITPRLPSAMVGDQAPREQGAADGRPSDL
jgi:hypothetical protein